MFFLSPLQPQNAGGGGWGGGRGGRGGYPGFVSLQVPTSEAAVSADTHAFARLPPGGPRKNRNLRGLVVFCGEKAPGPLLAKFFFLLVASQTSGSQNATITPNPLTLGGVGWFPKAELYSSMRGGVPVFAPAFQPLGRAPSPWRPGQQAPEPCIPVKNSKNAPVLIGS